MARIPWRSLALWALLGTAISVVLVLGDLHASRAVLGELVDTSPTDPSAAVLRAELGPDAVLAGGKHDGAYFYVIARDPFALQDAAAALDGPRYRLQRIGFPLAAWALHPTGGGPGLLWTMFVVGVLSVFGGAIATGALSVSWRGPPWLAALYGVLPGCLVSLRISVADPMALALALGALAVWVRHDASLVAAGERGPDLLADRPADRPRPPLRDPWCLLAVGLAVAATLTKETTLLVFAGFWLGVRTRRASLLVLVPAAVAGAWAVVLLWQVPAGDALTAFGLPLAGIGPTLATWRTLAEPLAPLSIVLAVLLSAAALWRRGLRHPFSYILVVQLLFLLVLNVDVLGPERSATRQALPMILVAALMLAAPGAARRPAPVVAAGTVA